MKLDTAKLIMTADLAGTFVFAVEGALAGVQGRLDLLGVLVLAFVTAVGGGIIRDLLIGAVPPQALRDWRYTAIAVAAGGLAFIGAALINDIPRPLIVTLDAAGLALFMVAGTEKALAFGIHPMIAPILGTITGCGGGTVRDLLLTRVPAVLRVDIYATAALLGAIVIVLGQRAGWPPRAASILGGLARFGLRMVAVWQHWHLPIAAG